MGGSKEGQQRSGLTPLKFYHLNKLYKYSKMNLGFNVVLNIQWAKRCRDYTRGVSCLFDKFEIAVSHLFLIIFSNNKFTLVYLISRNRQSPKKMLLSLFAGLKQSLKMSSQSLSD